jgi:serine/threonine protein kinase
MMAATWAQQQELRLGRYVLKRPLGEGGNGQVFLAWQENEAGEPLVCVVKFPLQRYATQADGRERFLAEARLAMRLGMHPNIVHVIDVGRHRDMPFIVMEYIDGTDLHNLLKVLRGAKQGLSLASAYNILASTVEALHHAHAGATIAGKPVGVVHRDIKPGNILVTRDGVTKVGDFGIGATIEEGTSGNFMRGTHRYMSPEHLRCEVRPEMDMYAFGVVAWEVLENRQFREGIRGPQHFTAIMDGRIPPMENPDTPKQLVSVIEACLETNPRQRPVASEVLRALERCPGYTRDPSSVKADVRKILGLRRSSGQTQHEFTATPELVATLAALEAVQVLPSRGADASELRSRAGSIGEHDSPAPPTMEGAPPMHSDVERVPPASESQPPHASRVASWSDAATPIAREARPAGAAIIHRVPEEDAPIALRRPRSPARGEPTPTLPLTGGAGDRPAREPTQTLGSLSPAATSGTEFVAPSWRSTDAMDESLDAIERSAGPAGAMLHGATQPGVAAAQYGSREPDSTAPSGVSIDVGDPAPIQQPEEAREPQRPFSPRPPTEPARSPVTARESPVPPRPSTEPGRPPSSPASIEGVYPSAEHQ